MLFPTVVFAVFFGIVYAGHWALHARPAAWKAFLLAASYLFYGWWDARFLVLIAASTLINHAAAVAGARTAEPRRRRIITAIAVVLNLVGLGFFKYYGFFVQSAYALCARIGLPCRLPLLDIILPVGISFFTFQALSYVLDVHRGRLPPARSAVDFGLYLAFFPQLVAGPIVRASVLLPQIETYDPPARLDLGRAATLILSGLFKKIVIANYLSTRLVDAVFEQPAAFGGWDNLAAVYGYAVQIYCDFSAYSDIAIGVALLLGFRFPINFDAPYFSSSVQDFWRRWHISLSTWLRDYLYIPLGGSRGSSGRTSVNLMLTFLLGGLWHGAGWTFIAWGALHGAYLVAGRLLPRPVSSTAPGFPRRLGGRILTFHLVCLSWVFFRSETFAGAFEMLGRIVRPGAGPVALLTGTAGVVMAVGFAMQALDHGRIERVWNALERWPAWALGALGAVALTIICALGPSGVAPFIYFQF
jgi:alginate O-acetyltransferase complex protein AlgI